MPLEVRPHLHGFAVFDGQARVSGLMSRAHAETRMEAIERERRIKRRPCLSCGDPFLSEGAHHRLCNRCRGRSGEADYPVGSLTGASRAPRKVRP